VTVQLRDGRVLTVRAIHADDRDKLQTAVRTLSPDARYSRFFSPLRELPAPLLERATHPDAESELQLVAVAGDAIVAGARYAATAEPTCCEFAAAVLDEWQRCGLAHRLIEELMRTARARGFHHMEGYILSSNVAMLGLAKRLGFAPVASPEEPTVRLMRCDLDAVD
jgi:GNAT superfamily N-acetyltransferase